MLSSWKKNMGRLTWRGINKNNWHLGKGYLPLKKPKEDENKPMSIAKKSHHIYFLSKSKEGDVFGWSGHHVYFTSKEAIIFHLTWKSLTSISNSKKRLSYIFCVKNQKWLTSISLRPWYLLDDKSQKRMTPIKLKDNDVCDIYKSY